MKKLQLLKTVLLLCALIVGSGNLWADNITYTFTSNAWAATAGGNAANWTSGKDGYQMQSGRGVQVTTGASGANATSPTSLSNISQIVVTYSTNPSAGVGSIAFQVGTGTPKSQDVTKTGGTTDRTLTYNFSPAETGNVKITVTCTTNSIYVKSVSITYSASGKSPAGLAYATGKYATTFGASFATPTLTNPNGLAVTYATSDATIADVNTSTGAVTIKNKAGNATITASTTGDATHDEGSASYKIYVYQHEGTSSSAFTVAEAKDFITNTLYDGETHYYVSGIVSQTNATISSGKNTYYISDDGTKTDQLQVYQGKYLDDAVFTSSTLVKLGEEVVVRGPLLYYSSKPEINTGNYLHSITTKTDANLVVHSDINNLEVTQQIADLYTTVSDGDVTITSDNDEVASIVAGKLVGNKPGNAKITVSVAFNATYAGAEKSFDVKVIVKDPVAPQGLSDVGFAKVTAPGDVPSGEYLLVYEDGSVAFNGGLADMDVAANIIDVDITDHKIPALENLKAATFTYDATANTLVNKAGKYIGRSEYSNALDVSDTPTLTNSLSIDASENVIITALESEGTGTNADKFATLQYFLSGAGSRFRYYTSEQKAIQLYKLSTTTTYDINIGSAGWRTIVPAASATLPSGVKAYYVASNVTAGVATLTEVNSIKAGEAYLLSGTAGDHTLTVTASPTEPTGNKLRVSTELDGNGAFVLANKTQGVGFYLWNGGSLGAGRVILPASAIDSFSSAHEFIGFDGGTTGIADVRGKTEAAKGDFYNLAGQRVAQPTKGLYIVNGKKIIMK